MKRIIIGLILFIIGFVSAISANGDIGNLGAAMVGCGFILIVNA